MVKTYLFIYVSAGGFLKVFMYATKTETRTLQYRV